MGVNDNSGGLNFKGIYWFVEFKSICRWLHFVNLQCRLILKYILGDNGNWELTKVKNILAWSQIWPLKRGASVNNQLLFS